MPAWEARVPADVDFVAFFPSNCRFLSQNCCISRIALQGNATNKFSATTRTMEMREMQNNITLKVQCTFWQDSLPSLSN